MRKPILAVIDISNINQAVIDYASSIARKFKLPLLLYNVQYTPSPIAATTGVYGASGYHAYEMEEEIKTEARKKMREIADELRLRQPDVEFAYELGFMADTIVDKSRWVLKKATEESAFLVVMQKEHEYNWWNYMLGTSETNIAENASCPVLIVPAEAKYRGISRVMHLIDAETLKSVALPNVEWLSNFSKRFNATLALAYLPNEGQELTQTELELRMNRIRDKMPFRKFFYYQFTTENTVEEMSEIAEISSTEVLAFSYESQSFFHRLFDNDDSRALILKTSLPVLVF